LAQTFTADKTGLLSEVDLWMGYSYNPTGSHSVTVYIQTTDPSGAPTGAPPPASPLTSADGLVPADPAWAPFVFPTPIGIASGATYAIVFVTHSPNAIYYAGPYAGSKTWSYDGSWASHDFQFAFQTFLGAATAAPPTVAMAFGAASIPVGGTTSLTYTITNPNAATAPVVRPALPGPGALTNIAFTDTLPAGLLIATPNNIGGGCGGAITATAGTSLVSITGLTLAAGASCGFGVDVIGTTAGTKNNATTAITSSEAGVGNSASASIVVAAPAAPTPAPTAAPTATPTAAPTATHTAAPTATPPTTSTVDHRGPGNEAPLLLFLVLTAIAGLLLTWLLLRPESRVRRR
jgi:hypothetical protein